MCLRTIKISYSQFIKKYSTDVRVRFAPSPTGYLHLGGLRTALYNYLFAKAHNGKYILRIEDTDQTRLVEGAVEQLEKDLRWCGIEFDEGPTQSGSFGPYFQSKRLNLYKKHVKTLLENGTAYHCFCTDRRLDLLRREAVKAREIPKYDNRCRHLTKEEVQHKLDSGQPSCIRFKISDKEESFEDLVYGTISVNISQNEGDPVIIKSDGYPTYHFANVVDDHSMKISHVLRGVEWQISTTKHIMLYRAFRWEPPQFAHLPLLMNADGSKLSKRQGDIRVDYYRGNGIFPLAVINFVVNSGGGFQKDLESELKPKIYTIPELCDQFDLKKVNSHSGKLHYERLVEFNRLELKRQLEDKHCEAKLIMGVKEIISNKYADRDSDVLLDLSDNHIRTVLHWAVDRISKLSELTSNKMEFLWKIPNSYYNCDGREVEYIEVLRNEIERLEFQERELISRFLKEFSDEHNIKYSSFMKTLRAIISGLKEGPSVAEMFEMLGKDNVLKRLDMFLRKDNRAVG